MRFYKWEIFCNLQSQDIQVCNNALEKWDHADEEYNQYLERNAELIPTALIRNDLHDFNLNNISFFDSQIQLSLIKPQIKTQIKYKKCISFEIMYNQIPSDYPKIKTRDFGSIVVQEIEYIDVGLYKKNILLDSGVEVSMLFIF